MLKDAAKSQGEDHLLSVSASIREIQKACPRKEAQAAQGAKSRGEGGLSWQSCNVEA